MEARRQVIDGLRRKIRALESGPFEAPRREASGVGRFDQVAGGLPTPGVVEVSGPAGSGRTRLAMSWLAPCTRRGEWVAWIDAERRLHPPGAAAWGVDLDRLLWIRPPADRLLWTVEQVARSGCFSRVVVADPESIGRAGAAWSRASRLGGCTLIVLQERSYRGLPACVRLSLGRDAAEVRRNRHGRANGRFELPVWPEVYDPWR